MNKIIILNHNQNSSKSASFFALNLASNIVNNSKKVLVFSTILSPQYFSELKSEMIISKSTKQILPFKIYRYKHKLNILLFGADTDQNIKIKSINEVLRLLKRQLELIQTNYDYLIIDLKNQWTTLDNYFIDDANVSFINYLEYEENVKFSLVENFNYFKTKHNINIFNYPFAISNYNGIDKNCLNLYSSLRTQWNVNELYCFNEPFSSYVNYVRQKPWSKNSIALESLIKKLI